MGGHVSRTNPCVENTERQAIDERKEATTTGPQRGLFLTNNALCAVKAFVKLSDGGWLVLRAEASKTRKVGDSVGVSDSGEPLRTQRLKERKVLARGGLDALHLKGVERAQVTIWQRQR